MPLYVDVHNVDATVGDGLADEDEAAVLCLLEETTRGSGGKVHREVHGLPADEGFEVDYGGDL